MGTAHGRYHPGSNSAPGQFQSGDALSIVPPIGVVRVSSVDHSSGNVGQYFNFDRAEIGLGERAQEIFVVANTRDGCIGQVIVWGSTNGGSTGTAHGRCHPQSKSSLSQFHAGDMLIRLS